MKTWFALKLHGCDFDMCQIIEQQSKSVWPVILWRLAWHGWQLSKFVPLTYKTAKTFGEQVAEWIEVWVNKLWYFDFFSTRKRRDAANLKIKHHQNRTWNGKISKPKTITKTSYKEWMMAGDNLFNICIGQSVQAENISHFDDFFAIHLLIFPRRCVYLTWRTVLKI